MTTKRKTEYNWEAGTVTIEGATFDLGKIPLAEMPKLALRALGNFLLTQDDAAAAFAELVKGKSLGRTPKPETLDPWREAAANVYAEHTIRAAGVKNQPGKKLRDAPEFQTALAEARKTAAAWTKAELAKAKASPEVVKEHAALTGVSSDLASLFAPLNPVAEEAPGDLAQAA